ncbi:helix-turn-helix transcriptional regulator [Herbiconiux moechotypicola]|uniref:Helix-turn-helix transcriptional regulator n=1 Tax=Herbiconiux moechotypicola TaxID=637393 RepID=A0ABN3DKW2_9MICO|nr:helix-turn-helix transcriptional regulator [Herbiconiux moechotypicola]MCS5730105.1 helix-turn-helix transcriptional regulator [Herbiconiux moechotypicola]
MPTKLGDFLRARRARLRAEDVGLPFDARRRVPGLRRSEVAALAGISTEYYLRLEQGREHQPSDQVMIALGRALRLDDDGVHHLTRLVRRGTPVRGQQRPSAPQEVDDSVLALLEQWENTPAVVLDACLDVLAANALASALVPGMFRQGANLLVSVVEGAPHAGDLESLWYDQAALIAAALRFHGNPDDPRYIEIVSRLCERDARFAVIWELHDVKALVSGVVHIDVPAIGWTEIPWRILNVPRSPGQLLLVFWGDAGSPARVVFDTLALRVAIARDDAVVESGLTGVAPGARDLDEAGSIV